MADVEEVLSPLRSTCVIVENKYRRINWNDYKNGDYKPYPKTQILFSKCIYSFVKFIRRRKINAMKGIQKDINHKYHQHIKS
jgi:hypothetical protein